MADDLLLPLRDPGDVAPWSPAHGNIHSINAAGVLYPSDDAGDHHDASGGRCRSQLHDEGPCGSAGHESWWGLLHVRGSALWRRLNHGAAAAPTRPAPCRNPRSPSPSAFVVDDIRGAESVASSSSSRRFTPAAAGPCSHRSDTSQLSGSIALPPGGGTARAAHRLHVGVREGLARFREWPHSLHVLFVVTLPVYVGGLMFVFAVVNRHRSYLFFNRCDWMSIAVAGLLFQLGFFAALLDLCPFAHLVYVAKLNDFVDYYGVMTSYLFLSVFYSVVVVVYLVKDQRVVRQRRRLRSQRRAAHDGASRTCGASDTVHSARHFFAAASLDSTVSAHPTASGATPTAAPIATVFSPTTTSSASRALPADSVHHHHHHTLSCTTSHFAGSIGAAASANRYHGSLSTSTMIQSLTAAITPTRMQPPSYDESSAAAASASGSTQRRVDDLTAEAATSEVVSRALYATPIAAGGGGRGGGANESVEIASLEDVSSKPWLSVSAVALIPDGAAAPPAGSTGSTSVSSISSLSQPHSVQQLLLLNAQREAHATLELGQAAHSTDRVCLGRGAAAGSDGEHGPDVAGHQCEDRLPGLPSGDGQPGHNVPAHEGARPRRAAARAAFLAAAARGRAANQKRTDQHNFVSSITQSIFQDMVQTEQVCELKADMIQAHLLNHVQRRGYQLMFFTAPLSAVIVFVMRLRTMSTCEAQTVSLLWDPTYVIEPIFWVHTVYWWQLYFGILTMSFLALLIFFQQVQLVHYVTNLKKWYQEDKLLRERQGGGGRGVRAKKLKRPPPPFSPGTGDTTALFQVATAPWAASEVAINVGMAASITTSAAADGVVEGRAGAAVRAQAGGAKTMSSSVSYTVYNPFPGDETYFRDPIVFGYASAMGRSGVAEAVEMSAVPFTSAPRYGRSVQAFRSRWSSRLSLLGSSLTRHTWLGRGNTDVTEFDAGAAPVVCVGGTGGTEADADGSAHHAHAIRAAHVARSARPATPRTGRDVDSRAPSAAAAEDAMGIIAYGWHDLSVPENMLVYFKVYNGIREQLTESPGPVALCAPSFVMSVVTFVAMAVIIASYAIASIDEGAMVMFRGIFPLFFSFVVNGVFVTAFIYLLVSLNAAVQQQIKLITVVQSNLQQQIDQEHYAQFRQLQLAGATGPLSSPGRRSRSAKVGHRHRSSPTRQRQPPSRAASQPSKSRDPQQLLLMMSAASSSTLPAALRAKVNALKALSTYVRRSDSQPNPLGISLEAMRWLLVIAFLGSLNAVFAFLLYDLCLRPPPTAS